MQHKLEKRSKASLSDEEPEYPEQVKITLNDL